jgi:hypothetical protein
MKFPAFLALLTLLTVPALAADIDGKWTGSIVGPEGNFDLIYSFKADGSTLNGAMVGPGGMEIKIADGKIEGNNISFSVTLNFGQEFTIAYKGVLSGSELKLTSDIGGQPVEFVLKKAEVFEL